MPQRGRGGKACLGEGTPRSCLLPGRPRSAQDSPPSTRGSWKKVKLQSKRAASSGFHAGAFVTAPSLPPRSARTGWGGPACSVPKLLEASANPKATWNGRVGIHEPTYLEEGVVGPEDSRQPPTPRPSVLWCLGLDGGLSLPAS